MKAILQHKDSVLASVLYMALELSNKIWKPGFSNGDRVDQTERIHQKPESRNQNRWLHHFVPGTGLLHKSLAQIRM